MSKDNILSKPRIPATLVAHVHDTTDNAVRTARSRWTPKTEEYKQTEEEIAEALEVIKKRRSV